MKFTLVTTARYYKKRDMNRLKKYGFTFEVVGKEEAGLFDCPWKRTNESVVELATLEDLMRFQGKVGAIILNGNSIEIYDDYRE